MHRLKTRAQFQATLSASTVARSAHFALHRLMLDDAALAIQQPAGPEAHPQALFVVGGTWVGAMVPKRWAKRSVTRNAIKRQIYTVSADFESRLPQAAHVVRLRTAFDRKHFVSASSVELKKAVRAELQQLFARVCT